MITAGAVLSVIVTAGVAVVLALLVFEDVALLAGRRPITLYVRALAVRYPAPTVLLAVALGALLGHLFWP